MSTDRIRDISSLDIVTLRRLVAAEDAGTSLAPAFVDTLVRLSAAGYVRGDSARGILVTDKGRQFAQKSEAASSFSGSLPSFGHTELLPPPSHRPAAVAATAH